MRDESREALMEFLSHRETLIGDIEEDARGMLGVIPFIFGPMKERPDLFILSALGDYLACRPPGMDPKTAELVAVAAAACYGSPDCLKVHIRAALQEGATHDELRDVLLISALIGKTKVLALAFRTLGEVEGKDAGR
ncbi:MAG: carboxymuconolactone decarboxylase family protein [Methanolinea sp.]|nr:carboxymuconolactone decarboxylase family protein [Methanolinea sp.]